MSDDEDEREDPFANFEEEPREGDPFEHLERPDEESDDGTGRPPPDSDDEPLFSGPERGAADERSGDEESVFGFGRGGETDDRGRPETGRRQDAHRNFPSMDTSVDDEEALLENIEGLEDDPFEDGTSVFQRMDVSDVDEDEVWERIREAREQGSVSDVEESVERVVSKYSYCHQCKYFSPPPDVSCSHEGTEIVEFPDMEHVLVVDCPIVANREEIEDMTE